MELKFEHLHYIAIEGVIGAGKTFSRDLRQLILGRSIPGTVGIFIDHLPKGLLGLVVTLNLAVKHPQLILRLGSVFGAGRLVRQIFKHLDRGMIGKVVFGKPQDLKILLLDESHGDRLFAFDYFGDALRIRVAIQYFLISEVGSVRIVHLLQRAAHVILRL